MKERVVNDMEEEVLRLSFEYLVKHGLENTSMRDLCKGTGISVGSMYYWFDSKDEVVISATEYGLAKASSRLFSYAYETITDMDKFFSTFLDEVDKSANDLRLVYQVATSPVYGERMRKAAEELSFSYDKYIKKLSSVMNISYEELFPVVFLIISLMLDYVVWDDRKVADIQFNYLYEILKNKIGK